MVACGDDGGANKLPDAPLADAATPDTPDQPVPARLTIKRDGVGVEGIDVYFQNADSSLVAKVPTNANGVAEARIAPGAFVTVVNPFERVLTGLRQVDVQTFAGVQPGDQLQLSEGSPERIYTNIQATIDPDPNGAQYKMWATCKIFYDKSDATMPYYFSVGSGGSDRPTATTDLVNCGSTTDMLIESEDGTGSSAGWIFKDDVAVSEGASIDITDAYTATPTVTLQYTDLPTTVFSIYASNVLATSDGPLWREALSIGSGGGSSISYQRPAPPTATQVFFTNLSLSSGPTSHYVVDWMPITTAPTLSLSNALLRRITSAPAYDAATATATWVEEATGEAPDLAIARVTATRDGTPLAWSWRLAGPVSGATLKYPTLPSEIAQYNVAADDDVAIYDLTVAKVPGGYNTVRPIVLSQDLAGFFAGTSGRVLVQRYFD